jgi:predicted nucleic acid-binding protein
MLLVVADTGRIAYLVEIGHVEILPQLFERILIPLPVCDELRHPSAPAPVRALRADLIFIDDHKGAAVALQKGFEITGTLGLLTRSAQRGLLDLTDALERLKRTNFFATVRGCSMIF